MINIGEKCVGCRACQQICPKQAITMQENEEGFIYPHINPEKCIKCNLCNKICPILKEKQENLPLEMYACVNKSKETLLKSSSGGFFTVLAEYVLQKDGCVFGSSFSEDLKVHHIMIEKIEQLDLLRKSKYVQSNTGNTYREAKEELETGRLVLYTGTPCQIAGLKSFLQKDYSNLITIDLICHGVPSQKLFDAYLRYIGKGKNITEYNFRDKEWNKIATMISYKRNNKVKKIKNPNLDPFYYAFSTGKTMRECCYQCKFANLHREGDYTIGDFWGIEKYNKKIKSNNGSSLVLINTEKGLEIFKTYLKNKIEYDKTENREIEIDNKNLYRPTEKAKEREIIYRDLNHYGFQYIVKKYCLPANYIFLRIKSIIPVGIKKIIKK